MSGHKLRLFVDGEDIGYDIVCLYDANDPTRPCAIPACDCPELEDGYHFNGEDCNGKTEPGCNAADWLENGGYESIAIPDRIEAEVAVDLSWGDPGPVFRAAPPETKSAASEFVHPQAQVMHLLPPGGDTYLCGEPDEGPRSVDLPMPFCAACKMVEFKDGLRLNFHALRWPEGDSRFAGRLVLVKREKGDEL